MCNYLFILVTFVYVMKTSSSQEYDEVDYYLKEENGLSDESSQVDATYKKVENEAKSILNNVKDRRKEPKRKLSMFMEGSTENEVDISSEIETMMNKIKHSVAGTKKTKYVTPCPQGEQLRLDTVQEAKYAKLNKDREPHKNAKRFNSDEVKLVKIQKDGKYLHRDDYDKSEKAKIEKSSKRRTKPEHNEVTHNTEINDFYERDEFYTTEEPERKPCQHSEQSESQEQSEEATKTPKPLNYGDKHIKRKEYKIRRAKLSQINKPCNDNAQNVKIKAKAIEPCKNCRKRGYIEPVTNSGEIITPKHQKNNQKNKEIYKSAEKKLATICENCQKFAQVEPYINPKVAKQVNLHNLNNKEDEVSVESKTKESEISIFNKPGMSQKNDELLDRKQMDKSREIKSVPCIYHPQIGRRGRTANDEEIHSKARKNCNSEEEKTVEIEILKSEPCKHKESSEENEHNKPCKYHKSEIGEEGNGNETNSIKKYEDKKPTRNEYESTEISETQQDHVERMEELNEINARNATTSGENNDKETTTEEVEEKKSKTFVSYPFSVSIQRKGAHYASGALLDKNWILTVAVEFYNVRETIKLYKARLGSVNCKRGGVLVALKRIEIHPQFIYKSPNFDIALIMIAKAVEFNDMIKPIGLSSVKTKVISAKFMTTYWSRVIIKGQLLPMTANERIKQTSLRVSTQKLIPWDWCESLVLIGNTTLDSSTLCLRPIESHHSLCTPDAGAPVVAEDGLWGITSGWTSNNCRSNPSPTVFTRVSSPVVGSWLDTIIKTS